MDDEKFYRGEFFDQLKAQLTSMEDRMKHMDQQLDSIENKIWYIYGFAAAIGIAGSWLWNWLLKKN